MAAMIQQPSIWRRVRRKVCYWSRFIRQALITTAKGLPAFSTIAVSLPSWTVPYRSAKLMRACLAPILVVIGLFLSILELKQAKSIMLTNLTVYAQIETGD